MSSSHKWAAAQAPVHDELEREADIPNGERALARFTASYMRKCRAILSLNVGTLYLSKSYALFVAHHVNVSREAVRLVLPLSKVQSIEPANYHRVLKNGISIQCDDDSFLFILGKKEDQDCAIRLVTVLSDRARSGAHLHPQSAIATQSLLMHSDDKPPQKELDRFNSLTFESRSRHRRRRSREDGRDRRRLRRAASVQPSRTSSLRFDSDDSTAQRQAECGENLQDAAACVSKLELSNHVLQQTRTYTHAFVTLCDTYLIDVVFCVIAAVAIVIAICTLQVAEMYSLRLRLLGMLVMSY